MRDEEAVRAANREFYAAFEALDRQRMESVWLRSARVRCTHPGWRRLDGFEAVIESWARIFENSLGMSFTILEEQVAIMGDLAWVVCTESLETRTLDGVIGSMVEATNLFERHGDRWLLVHHHGSPLLEAPASDEPDPLLH